MLFVLNEKQVKEKGFSLPWVYLMVPLGTISAFEAVDPLQSDDEEIRHYPYYRTVFGHLIDDDYSMVKKLPANIEELKNVMGGLRYSKVDEALRFFHKTWGHRYWGEETKNSVPSGFTPDDMRLGYRKGGWTVVTSRNCPNNSLPVLWYPFVGSPTKEINSLFPRLESRMTHVGRAVELESRMDDAFQDKKMLLNKYLKSFFTSLR
jgi:hypothetical protein